ncbi:MAG: EscV/YscV/HrcV family type III secretion system export apparatus protein, partial [Mesorhizobium sp.]
RHNRALAAAEAQKNKEKADKVEEEKNSVKASLATAEIELLIGKQLSTRLLVAHQELVFRMSKMRKKFAQQYGFVVPEVRVADDFAIPPKSYQIKVHGTVVAEYQMRVGEIMVLLGTRGVPDIPGEEIREPAFGMRAYSVLETFAED